MGTKDRIRTLDEWLFSPMDADRVCVNRFHDIAGMVYQGYSSLDPDAPDDDDYRTKVAQLMRARLILLGGDVIYVRPVTDGLVWRNVMRIDYPSGKQCYVDLRTLNDASRDVMQWRDSYPEFGVSRVNPANYGPIRKFFSTLDAAVGEDWFFEQTMMYHFNQPYREKSHVLVGGGGNGKSMFMGLVKRLYGDFAMTDAPQPNFTGHAAAVIAYNFIGKRIVTFNDVGDPSVKFLEWMKRMITGNLEVKTPNGAWLSVPCNANFLMETNHAPQILSLEAHRRRFIIREFDPDFRLKDWVSDPELDRLGDRGDITAADLVNYMLTIRDKVGDWTSFGAEPEDLDWCEEEVAE